MKHSLNNHFIFLYLPFAFLGLLMLLLIPKGDILLFLNEHQHPIADQLFKYTTHLGNGLMFILIFVILLFIRFYDALFFLIVSIAHSIPVVMMKMVLFKAYPRPIVFFTDLGIKLNLIDGVTIQTLYPFPSGHTAFGFTIMFSLSLLCKNRKWLSLLFFIMACMIGMSRIYLSQHFFMDVYMGALISMIIVPATYYYMALFQEKRTSLGKWEYALLRKHEVPSLHFKRSYLF